MCLQNVASFQNYVCWRAWIFCLLCVDSFSAKSFQSNLARENFPGKVPGDLPISYVPQKPAKLCNDG